MNKQFRTIKIWNETWRTLRMIAAITDESLVALIDGMAREKLAQKQDAQRYEAEYRAQAPGQD